MKLIKQSKLFFKEGNSDKVYELDLCEVEAGRYVVNFRYGKRGANLKEGTKTDAPVALADAEKIYSTLEAEKRKKGYSDEEQTLVVLPRIDTQDKPKTKEEAILRRLSLAAEGKADTAKIKWRTSRVIWKAGELQLKEAAPFIVKLIEKGDDMQRYAALWALGRCGDNSVTKLLSAYFENQKYSDKIRRIAGAALLELLQDDERKAHLSWYVNRLPEAIKIDLLAGDLESLQAKLNERVLVQKHNDYIYVEHLYLISKDYRIAKKAVIELLKQIPLRPGYFKHIRHIYKMALLREDAEALGLLTYRFENTAAFFKMPPKYGSSNPRAYINGENMYPYSEVKKADSKIAYSDKTRRYFYQHGLNLLENAGTKGSTFYVKLATAILLAYDYEPAKPHQRNEWKWENNRWKEIKRYSPPFSSALLLNQILYANSSRYQLDIISKTWKCAAGYVPKGVAGVKPTVLSAWRDEMNQAELRKPEELRRHYPLREEAHPALWDAMPQAYIQLLVQSKREPIHDFALDNLQNHADYATLKAQIGNGLVQSFLSSPFQYTALFGLELAKERHNAQNINPELTLSLFNNYWAELRKTAQEWIAEQPKIFAEPRLLKALLFSTYTANQPFTTDFYKTLSLTTKQKDALLGLCLAELQTTTDKNILTFVTQFLNDNFQSVLTALPFAVIQDLLSHSSTVLQIWAATLLKNHQKPVTQIPASVFESILNSDDEGVRKTGMELLAQFPDSELIKREETLAAFCVSIHGDIRDSVKPLIGRLSAKYTEFSVRLVNRLVPLLMRKETSDGLHASISSLLSNELVEHLHDVDKQTALRLLYSHYIPAQDFGIVLFDKYIQAKDLTVRQIIAMGDHEILAARLLCQRFFNENVGRMRYEREEALRLLDAKWDDTRAFAIQFFRQKFVEGDWNPSLMIGIADSVRPDIQAFGRELITKFFDEEQGDEYLLKLSQHPSVDVQLFATNYLERYAANNPERITALEHYFRSVLMRVNKARTAKNRVLKFLYEEAKKSEKMAIFVAEILTDISATVAIQDKATCIDIMRNLIQEYPNLTFPMKFMEVEER